jgi:hypothetical protein
MLRSAFSRDSVHGWFYIEAFMNPMLAKLLHFNHQLIHPQEGFGAIDMEEWTMLLDMDGERYPSVGDLVTVCHGLYKGDVGYVMSVKNWGQVTLLLVPRLPPPPRAVSSSSGKRKQSGTHTNPCLFTMEMVLNIAVNYRITQFQQGVDNSWWNILGHKFEHTLEVRTFNHHSVTPTSSMPSTTFYEFQNAPHPVIMNTMDTPEAVLAQAMLW